MITALKKTLSKGGIAYHRAGSGSQLLLIHGVGLRSESWKHYVEALSDQCELVIVDLPGHGASAPVSESFTNVELSYYVTAIENLVQELKLEQPIACGHSLGALIAIELAANTNNQISGLVALNAINHRSDRALAAVKKRANDLYASQRISGVDHTIHRWFGEVPTKEMQNYADLCAAWLAANSVAGYAKAYKSFASVRGPSQISLNSISCPTIFMTGEQDPNSSPQMSASLADSVSIAHYKTVVGAAHMMPLTHAPQVCEEIIRLLNAQGSENPSATTHESAAARVRS